MAELDLKLKLTDRRRLVKSRLGAAEAARGGRVAVLFEHTLQLLKPLIFALFPQIGQDLRRKLL